MRQSLLGPTSLIISAAFLAACVDAETQIRPEGSGEFRLVVSYTDRQLEEFAAHAANQGKTPCGQASRYLPSGMAFTEVAVDTGARCELEYSFVSFDDLRQFYTQFSHLTVNHLEWNTCTRIYDVDLDASSVEDLSSLEWHVTMPGLILSHNAESDPTGANGGWELSWRTGAPATYRIYVRSLETSSPECIRAAVLPFLPVGLAAAAAALAGLLYYRRQRRSPQPSPPQPMATEPREVAVPRFWRTTFRVLEIALMPIFLVAILNASIGIASLPEYVRDHGPVSVLDFRGFGVPSVLLDLALTALPLLYWLLLRRRWFVAWRRAALVLLGLLPIAAAIRFCATLIESLARMD